MYKMRVFRESFCPTGGYHSYLFTDKTINESYNIELIDCFEELGFSLIRCRVEKPLVYVFGIQPIKAEIVERCNGIITEENIQVSYELFMPMKAMHIRKHISDFWMSDYGKNWVVEKYDNRPDHMRWYKLNETP